MDRLTPVMDNNYNPDDPDDPRIKERKKNFNHPVNSRTRS